MELSYGFFGSIVGLVSFIPIMYHVIATKNTSNFVWSGLLMAILSSFLWMMEGITMNSLTLVINTFLYIIMYFIIVVVKIFYN